MRVMLNSQNLLEMNKTIKTICLLLFSLAVLHLSAQEVSPVDFMKTNPYQMRNNPSTELPYDSHVAIGIGNICGDFRNLNFRLDNLFRHDASGKPVAIDLNGFANSLQSENGLNSTLDYEVLGFGKKSRHGYVTYSHRVRFQWSNNVSDDLFQLAAFGNGAFVGNDNPVDVKLNLNALCFQEFALGYRINAAPNLSVGGRVKLLFGVGEAKTEAFDVKVVTDDEDYSVCLTEDMALRMTSPMPFQIIDNKIELENSRFNVADLFHSPGFGIDLAAEYHFNEHFDLMAAVNDLGFISWKNKGVMLNGYIVDNGQFYDEGAFLFQGIDISELQSILSDNEYRNEYFNDMKDYFRFETEDAEPYTTMLHTNILLRGTYALNDKHRFIAQLQGYCSGLGVRPAMTLAYNATLNRTFDLCATYSVMKRSFDNLGLGFTCNLKFFHIYAATNNIKGCFKPLNTSGVNFQAGIVFTVVDKRLH